MGAGGFLQLPGLITWPAYMIVFLFCIRGLGQALKSQGLTRSPIFLTIMVGLSYLLPCVFGCIWFIGAMGAVGSAARAGGNPDAAVGAATGVGILGAILGGILALVWLGTYIWYLVLLFQTRSAISEHVERA
jgi:hypothetical protein